MKVFRKVLIGATATAATFYAGTVIASHLIDNSQTLQKALLERVRKQILISASQKQDHQAERNTNPAIELSWNEAKLEVAQNRATFKHVTFSQRGGNAPNSFILHADNIELRLASLWKMVIWPSSAIQSVDIKGVVSVIDSRGEINQQKDVTKKEEENQNKQQQQTNTKNSFFSNWKLSSLQISDAHLTLFSQGLRPLSIDVHKFECGKIRSQWILHDLLYANSLVGRFDGSLFVLQKRIRKEGIPEMTFKMDGMNVDIIGSTTSAPLSWLRDGTVDISIRYLDTIMKKLKPSVTNNNDTSSSSSSSSSSQSSFGAINKINDCLFSAKFDLLFRNVRCEQRKFIDTSIPLTLNAFVPLLVNYFNKQKQLPLSFDIGIPLSNLKGAKGVYDSGLLDAISTGLTTEFVKIVPNRSELVSSVLFH